MFKTISLFKNNVKARHKILRYLEKENAPVDKTRLIEKIEGSIEENLNYLNAAGLIEMRNEQGKISYQLSNGIEILL
jgi:hypothetical protein